MVHGEKYGWSAKAGPTIALVEHFTSYCFCTRQYGSAIGREGLGDSFELQIRYMLAKFVFVALKYKGWVRLTPHALHVKAEPYKFAVREHWKRLKRSDEDLMSTLKPFVKTKWCDTAYFLAQVRERREGERGARTACTSEHACDAHVCAQPRITVLISKMFSTQSMPRVT